MGRYIHPYSAIFLGLNRRKDYGTILRTHIHLLDPRVYSKTLYLPHSHQQWRRGCSPTRRGKAGSKNAMVYVTTAREGPTSYISDENKNKFFSVFGDDPRRAARLSAEDIWLSTTPVVTFTLYKWVYAHNQGNLTKTKTYSDECWRACREWVIEYSQEKSETKMVYYCSLSKYKLHTSIILKYKEKSTIRGLQEDNQKNAPDERPNVSLHSWLLRYIS